MIRLERETLMLYRTEKGWQIKPCPQPFQFDLSGRVQEAPLDPDFHQLAPRIYSQAFPSRYQALQAARGLLWSAR